MKAPTLLPEEFTPAIVGVARRGDVQVFVYSEWKVIELLMEDYDLGEEEAYDQFYSDILVSGQDESAPFFLADFFDVEELVAGTD